LQPLCLGREPKARVATVGKDGFEGVVSFNLFDNGPLVAYVILF
jgi:hypothetical protein